MKLSELTAKPKLIKLSIDDEETIKEFGEAIDFWVYDRQKVDTFMRMATLENNDVSIIAELVTELIYDEDGKKIITDETALPVKIMMKVIPKVVESLGNTISQTSAK